MDSFRITVRLSKRLATDLRARSIAQRHTSSDLVRIALQPGIEKSEPALDQGGLLLAYAAWKDDTKGQTLEPIDDLTPDQRFFVGHGQSWCGQVRDESKRMRATIDPHSPEKYRTNGVVSNMPQFQRAFHCKAGSPTVNQNRCSVW